MDLGATPIFEISLKNCKSEPELKFEVENWKLILPQRTCALVDLLVTFRARFSYIVGPLKYTRSIMAA